MPPAMMVTMGQRKSAIAYIRYWSNTSQPASKIHTPRTLQAMASLSLTVAPKSSKTWVLLSPYEVVLSPAGYRASRDHSAGPWLKENGSLAALGRSLPRHGYIFPERSIYKVCKNMEGGSPRPHPPEGGASLRPHPQRAEPASGHVLQRD